MENLNKIHNNENDENNRNNENNVKRCKCPLCIGFFYIYDNVVKNKKNKYKVSNIKM